MNLRRCLLYQNKKEIAKRGADAPVRAILESKIIDGWKIVYKKADGTEGRFILSPTEYSEGLFRNPLTGDKSYVKNGRAYGEGEKVKGFNIEIEKDSKKIAIFVSIDDINEIGRIELPIDASGEIQKIVF